MKKNLTEIVFILDQSGSMYHLKSDTIGGYNAYIEDQKKEPGEAYLTTILFDTEYYELHNHLDIRQVPPLTEDDYRPGGCTALLDAVGRTIDRVGKRLAETPEDERPGHVIFVIITDGYENSSTDYTRDRVKEMIQHQQDKYSWEFLFLGAGIDAYQEAASIGVNAIHTMSAMATTDGLNNVYTSVSNASKAIRTSTAGAQSITDNKWKVGDIGQ